MKRPRLERVIIYREGDGWAVVRERAKNGETISGLATLEDAFNAVRCIYDENGERTKEKQESL